MSGDRSRRDLSDGELLDRIADRHRRDTSRLVEDLDHNRQEEHVGDLADRLRAAIEASPLSQYEISKRSGVSEGVLSRFMRGERGITLETLEKLAGPLGLELTLKTEED